MWTTKRPDLVVPVELGAELLHGHADEIDEIAGPAGLPVIEVAGRRWTSRRGRLTLMDDFWERLDRVMRRLDADTGAIASGRAAADALVHR